MKNFPRCSRPLLFAALLILSFIADFAPAQAQMVKPMVQPNVRVLAVPRNTVTHTRISGPNSLYEAINYANAFNGTTIRFNIPTSDPGYQNGVFTIGAGTLPQFTATTIIDGTTQTTFTGNTNASGPEVVVSSSTLAMDANSNITLKGVAYGWTSGTVAGVLNITSGGTLNISGNSGRSLTGTINNAGATTWSGTGTLYSWGTFNNSGSFNAQANADFVGVGNNSVFNNSGTFARSGSGVTTFMIYDYDSGYNLTFNNTGTVDVIAGTLSLRCRGTHSGALNIASGAIIVIGSLVIDYFTAEQVINVGSTVTAVGTGKIIIYGRPTLNGTLSVHGGTLEVPYGGSLRGSGTTSVTGTLDMSGGVLEVKATVTGTLNMSSGTIGPQTTVTGNGNWITGSIEGTLNIPRGGSLNISGINNRYLTGTINNSGTTTWSGTGNINSSGTFNNSGTLNAQSDAGFGYGSSDAAFNNSGTVTKSGGSGTTLFFSYYGGPATFNNSGTVNANSGTIFFDCTHKQTAGTTKLNGGNISGALDIQGGTLTGAGTITGSVTNGGTVSPGAAAGVLNISGDYVQTAAGKLDIQIGGRAAGTQAVTKVVAAFFVAFGRDAIEHDIVIRPQLPLSLASRSEPEPDIAVVAGTADDYRYGHPNSALLVVEVSDSTLAYDRTGKAGLYAAAGIPEYWISNLPDHQLEVHRHPQPDPAQPHGHRYSTREILNSQQAIASLFAPHILLQIAELLP